MTRFEHTVCQLMIGCQSRPSPEAQSIACSIVEGHMLTGQAIVGKQIHLAVNEQSSEQTTVDFDSDL